MANVSRLGPPLLLTLLVSLALAPSTAAHSSISPPVAKSNTLQQFTLEIQAEKEKVRTARVEVTFPDGFNVESFAASPAWKRTEVAGNSGEGGGAARANWEGGQESPQDDPVFHFTGTLESAKTYAVRVRQIYADGSVVEWTGNEDSKTPAAFVQGVSGIGSSRNTLTVVVLAISVIAVVLAIVGLVRGDRPLA
jgi:uncharacterized protein YcnI